MKNIYLLLFTQLIFSQLQLNSFYPTSNVSGLSFGNKVDINNNEVIASSASSISINQGGRVYVFSVNSNNLNLFDVLIEPDVTNNDLFGSSLSIENQKIAVGAPNQGANFSSIGAVYMYKKVGANYQLVQKILSINNTTNDKFGRFVKLFNDRLYISAKESVYVYDFNGTIWTLTQTITIAGITTLGNKIEVDNTKLIISSSSSNDGISNYTIHNYSSIVNSNQWVFENSANIGLNESDYGIDFKLYNSQLYVVKNTSKQVSIYDFISNSWELSSTFNFFQSDQVYDEIVVSDTDLFLGSNWYVLQMTRKFPVLHFKKIDTIWTAQPSISSNEINSQVDDYFGSSMAVQGNQLVIGCKGERNGSSFPYGKVYFGDTLLGLEANDLNAFYFYPNPTKEYLHLNNDFLDEIKSISIYQIDGKIVSNINSNFEKIDIRNFKNGAYFMKIQFKNNIIITKKIVKN